MQASGGQPVTSRRGSFWVGVEPLQHESGTLVHGPMYVYWEEPAEVLHPLPLVLVHGGGGQGTDYLVTPDGRPGWASDLVELGYKVYVVDRPGHGRSPVHPDATGAMGPPPTREFIQWLFTPPFEGEGSHPTAHLHTQWPGTREADDPVLDQFWAGTGPMLADFEMSHALEGARLAELLDRIGEAVLVTHSAGGPAGWLAADARPDLVKALVAIETMGPPFAVVPQMGLSLVWGLAAAPLTFDPPVTVASELALVTNELDDGRPPMTLQAEPARSLPNLAGIPIAVVSAEASVFLHIDENTVAFLRQAGCDVDLVRLADHGVHGNGHGMMLEKNSRDALRVVVDWLESRLPGT